MQRFVLIAFVGLCLAAFAAAGDFQIGQREEGDVLLATIPVTMPAVSGRVQRVSSGFGSASIITEISGQDAPGTSSTLEINYGGVGFNYLKYSVISDVGSALDVEINVYGRQR